MTLQRFIPLIFAFTLFLSATLVFSVQPMLGKMMLPHVGGAPSGWAVTMFFFQTCLLFGYGLAYLFSKLPPFTNIIAILLVFVPASIFLPIAYHSGISDSVSPWAVFVQLTISTAVPFLALSTLAPGLQKIFSHGTHKTASDPYYLYAASNLGSFTGLLAYPLVFEPFIGLALQSQLWMIAYAVLFCSVIFCAFTIFNTRRDLISLKVKNTKSDNKTVAEPISWRKRIKWLCMAAIPSSLMIGTTTEITTDIASAPLLWVIPLGLYLLTNIVAFAKRGHINTKNIAAFHIIFVILAVSLILIENYVSVLNDSAILIALFYIVSFTNIAYLFHAELANSRPSTARLTEFYLILALGGAIGGSFNAFIAPSLFNDVYEYQLVLILSLIFNPSFATPLTASAKKIIIGVYVALLAVLTILIFKQGALFIALLVAVLFMASIHTKTLLFACSAVCIFLMTPFNSRQFLHVDRNFFGVVKVYEGKMDPDHEQKGRILMHGTTLHGFQALEKNYAFSPNAYYSAKGPVGDVMNTLNPKTVAVLGLGVGQISCYKKPGRDFTYYEIDPHVVDVAKNKFDVLTTCGYKDIILGDARLEITKIQELYDLIVVDVFSSDSIPLHLITSEAIELYKNKLNKNGAVIINISNRHLDLNAPIAASAKNVSIGFRTKPYASGKDNPYDFASEWIVLTDNSRLLSSLDQRQWRSVDTNIKPWTDDYSNIISTVKLFKKIGEYFTHQNENQKTAEKK